jgi:hypothetical protein
VYQTLRDRSPRFTSEAHIVKKKFHDLLHQYKVEAFKISHNKQVDEDLTAEVKVFIEKALNDEFRYHFHREPSAERLETFQMIKNFTTEALMPPIIDRIMRRVIALEKQHELMVDLVDGLLKALSDEISAKSGG